MDYTDYSNGKLYFKLPKGAFEYQETLSDGSRSFYGIKDSNVDCICCDVIISACGTDHLQSHEMYEWILNLDEQTQKKVLAESCLPNFKVDVQQGRSEDIIELIINDRTVTLNVRECGEICFCVTTSRSLDKEVTIHALKEFAYEILETIDIIDGEKLLVDFHGLSQKGSKKTHTKMSCKSDESDKDESVSSGVNNYHGTNFGAQDMDSWEDDDMSYGYSENDFGCREQYLDYLEWGD